ncbi:MAG: hypothetical protein ACOCVM_04655 [Desulfovibrionaceae bacterium]
MPVHRVGALSCLLALLLCLTSPASAEQMGEKGAIDWVNGVVVGYGYGTAKQGMNQAQARIASIRAAKVDAMRNLLETVKGVQIDSRTLVEDYIVKKDLIAAKVSGLVKGAHEVDKSTEIMEDGAPLTTVTMAVCINPGSNCYGSLVDALNLADIPDQRIPNKKFAPPAELQPGQKPAQPNVYKPQQAEYRYDSSKPVTGVVFNLQGRPFKQEVRPVVAAKRSGDLAVVYSFKNVSPAVIRQHGVIRYAETSQQAVDTDVVGDNPLVVPVQEVTPENVILVTQDGARKVFETTRHGNDYLAKARAAISYR